MLSSRFCLEIICYDVRVNPNVHVMQHYEMVHYVPVWLLFQDFQIQLLYNCTQISANQTKCEVKSRKNEVEELKIGHLCSVTVDVARIFTT